MSSSSALHNNNKNNNNDYDDDERFGMHVRTSTRTRTDVRIADMCNYSINTQTLIARKHT